MQLFSFSKASLLMLSLLFLLLAYPDRAGAQNLEPADLASQLTIEGNDILAREERTGNLDRLGAQVLPLAGSAGNQPPEFTISPETRTIRVGERVTFRFAFGDPENDPYFAGVIAVTPRVKLERLFETRKEGQRAASVKIDVLAPDNPATVVWNVTAQNPGVAVFFVSIAELFVDNTGGNLKLSSGKISHVAYVLRVIGDNDEGSAPVFLDRLNDMRLRIGERVGLTFSAESAEGRPLSYGFLFLAYASRLVRGKIGLNLLDLKAIEPGQGLFVAYVTDGRKADIQTFLITVADPADPPESKFKLRALSANGMVGRAKPAQLDLYGENFTAASQVVMSTPEGEQFLPAEFVSPTNLKIDLPTTLRGPADFRVQDGANRSESIPFRVLRPVITDIKRVRNDSGAVGSIRIFGLGVGSKVKVTANGEELKLIKERSVKTRFGDQVVVALPSRLRREQSLELRLTNDAGIETTPIILPLNK
jgi:hypothetical protein